MSEWKNEWDIYWTNFIIERHYSLLLDEFPVASALNFHYHALNGKIFSVQSVIHSLISQECPVPSADTTTTSYSFKLAKLIEYTTNIPGRGMERQADRHAIPSLIHNYTSCELRLNYTTMAAKKDL